MENKYTFLKDRLKVLFALSVKKHDEKGECPDSAEFAALIDGNVSSEKREALFSHVDACPECYHEWLTATAILSDNDKTDVTDRHHHSKTGFFNTYKARFAIATAVAASLVCLIYFNMFTQPSVSTMINRQYQLAMAANHLVKDADRGPDLLIQENNTVNQGYGFAGLSIEKPSPFAQTFISGYNTGSKMLINRETPPDKIADTNKAYFWAGRWFALISYVCKSNDTLPENLWEVQHDTAQWLINDLSRHEKEQNEAVILTRSIQRIDKEMVQKQNGACRMIISELNFVTEGLNASK
ncbi:MAG: hypothetical protein KJ737_22795 [Proteobacteria bacterium]|nr:hypothetical protein [Pseudomonadota bacterium]